MEKQKFITQTALMPLCYRDFHCLAAACRDNCCGGWEIAFNKKDYLRIKRSAKSKELKGLLTEGMHRIREESVYGHYAHFEVGPEGTCAFQTEEGLCRLQLECGEETLPEVCRTYPRRIRYTPAAREFSLSPSCEGVLALLWNLPQGLDFWEEPLPKKDWKVAEMEPQWTWFADVRSFCVDVLQERSLPFFRRMQLLGLLLQRLIEMDWTAEETKDVWLAWAEQQPQDPSVASDLNGLPQDRLEFLTGNLRMLLELYGDTAAGAKELYRSLLSALSADENWEKGNFERFFMDTIRYERLERQLEELLGHSDYFFENLMVETAFYLIFPSLETPGKLWRSYVGLSGLYSFYRFAAVLGCYQEASRERLFQVIGTISRGLLHNTPRWEKMRGFLLEHDGGSMAYMTTMLDS